jgi:hypothetical protein
VSVEEEEEEEEGLFTARSVVILRLYAVAGLQRKERERERENR